MNDDANMYAEETPFENVQSLIKDVRDKAYRAAGMIKELKQQARNLEERNTELESIVAEMQKSLQEKTLELQQAREEAKSASPLDVGDRLLYFSPDEREALERQINELLSRVSSHLR